MKKLFKPYARRIHIKNKVWTYKIGKSNVCVCNPACTKRWYVGFDKITGMDWPTIERGQWKRWFHIEPSMVRNWIVKTIMDTK